MTRSTDDPDPSKGLPDLVISELEQSSDRQLRTIIHYAQDLLHQRHDPTTALEPREGEEILRMDDHGPYTLVIVKRTDVTGLNQGPFAYRVKYEPSIEGDEGKFRWRYLGRVEE